METILNMAWALCSLGLLGFWLRTGATGRGAGRGRVRQTWPYSRRTQFLALGMALLLLLPVISLSDDLVAAQGLTETDSSLRRAANVGDGHPSVVPQAISLPVEMFTDIAVATFSRNALDSEEWIKPICFYSAALDRRPPPSRV